MKYQSKIIRDEPSPSRVPHCKDSFVFSDKLEDWMYSNSSYSKQFRNRRRNKPN